MCQQAIQFCSGSTKPLVFAGAFLTLLLALGVGYLACSAESLVEDILSPAAAAQSGRPSALSYHLQLAASAYLILISVFACVAAHYDQKHSIRALAALTSLNFLLAIAAILLVPAGNSPEFANEFKLPLSRAMESYNFTLSPPPPQPAPQSAEASSSNSSNVPAASGQSSPDGKLKQKRTVLADGDSTAPINGTIATGMWDNLQNRGCCGFENNTEWLTSRRKLPKSCCAKADEQNKEFVCMSPDEQHARPCIAIIESVSISTKNLTLLLVLALIALVNLYLANVTGISAYRTFHYNEASQNAYS